MLYFIPYTFYYNSYDVRSDQDTMIAISQLVNWFLSNNRIYLFTKRNLDFKSADRITVTIATLLQFTRVFKLKLAKYMVLRGIRIIDYNL